MGRGAVFQGTSSPFATAAEAQALEEFRPSGAWSGWHTCTAGNGDNQPTTRINGWTAKTGQLRHRSDKPGGIAVELNCVITHPGWFGKGGRSWVLDAR